MPLYIFECEECKKTFEVNASIKEKESGLQPCCPICHSAHSRQLITSSFVINKSGNGNMTSGCNPSSGCCG